VVVVERGTISGVEENVESNDLLGDAEISDRSLIGGLFQTDDWIGGGESGSSLKIGRFTETD
jgi:hypothetical protein